MNLGFYMPLAHRSGYESHDLISEEKAFHSITYCNRYTDPQGRFHEDHIEWISALWEDLETDIGNNYTNS